MDDLPIADHLSIPAKDLRWQASRSSGPGGQHVNKTSTKVELRFAVTQNATLSATVKARLRRLAGSRRLDTEGHVLITEQSSRSQVSNLDQARSALRTLIRQALIAPKRRKASKPSRGAKKRRLDDKRRQSEKKRARQRSSDWTA